MTNRKMQMVEGKCKVKKMLTNIESLPYELLFSILLQLSVEDIYNGAMLVSRKWYSMICSHDFVHAHLQHHSTQGLLVQNFFRAEEHSSFVAIRQGRIEVSKCNYSIGPKRRWNSCNGLILDYDVSKQPLRFVNPAIKKIFEIPPFTRGKAKHHWWCIAYSAASKEYKVVHTYELIADKNLQCDIVTIGVDKSWRDVSTQHLSPATKDLLRKNPITTEGFLHCIDTYNPSRFLTFNVESETIAENPILQEGLLDDKWRIYLSTGKSLSMFVKCGILCYEGWEMKSETGEWTKVYKIDLNAHQCKFEELYGKKYFARLMPGGWLKYPEVVVLCFSCPNRVCIAYDVRTHKIESFELNCGTFSHRFKVHSNSLVGLVRS